MAITVSDIQNAEFSTQGANGYNVDEVDDFLDAIAEQQSELVRESVALSAQNKELLKKLEAAKAEIAAANAKEQAARAEIAVEQEKAQAKLQAVQADLQAKLQAVQADADAANKELAEIKSSPYYGDDSYFKNLQVAIRASLVRRRMCRRRISSRMPTMT